MQDRRLNTLTGMVVSNSGNKSVKVVLDYKIRHPKYGKYIKRRMKIGVHDENNLGGIGDVIEIAECRPRSKTKSWRLVKVLKKAGQA